MEKEFLVEDPGVVPFLRENPEVRTIHVCLPQGADKGELDYFLNYLRTLLDWCPTPTELCVRRDPRVKAPTLRFLAMPPYGLQAYD